MSDKKMLIDFINYGIIAAVFLVIPYSITRFLCIIVPLILDLIQLYIVESQENNYIKK